MSGKLYNATLTFDVLFWSEDGTEPSESDLPDTLDLMGSGDWDVEEYSHVPAGWDGRCLVFGSNENMTVDEAIERHKEAEAAWFKDETL